MESDEVDPLLNHSSTKKSANELSIFRLILITFLQLGLNVVQNSSIVITLPYEIKKLFPAKPALALGLIVATSSAFTILNPVIGFYSDRCTSSWGRRRPFIALGSALIVCGVMGCWTASSKTLSLAWPYAAAFIVMQIGLIISNAGFNALMPDIVPVPQRGVASGVFGILGILGSAIGYVAVGAALPLDKTSLSYFVMAATMVISAGITIYGSKEIPLTRSQKLKLQNEAPDLKSSVKQMVAGLKYKDFTLVLISRVCYFMSLAPQAYLLYLIDDLTNASNPELSVTFLALSAQVAGLLITIPSGKLSDRFGRKIFVYGATFLIVIVYELFCLSSSIYLYYILGAVYGIANGMYFTVELALGMDCFPPEDVVIAKEDQSYGISTPEDINRNEPHEDEDISQSQSTTAGRNMGLWGIAQSLGMLLGLYLLGPLLQVVGGTGDKDHYTRVGYFVIFTLGSIFAVVSSLMVFLIKTGHKKTLRKCTVMTTIQFSFVLT